MHITDYYFRNAYHYRNATKRVEPVVPAEDSAYENPEKHQKGKRTFLAKRPISQKFPEENFKPVGSILSIWV